MSIKEVAERWREGKYTSDQLNEALVDSSILATAYINEHPADDEAAITGDWLASVTKAVVSCSFVIGELRIYESLGEWCVAESRGYHIATLKTRGQVRLLCRALGIELKEAK